MVDPQDPAESRPIPSPPPGLPTDLQSLPNQGNPNLIEFNEPPFAGTFIRLEQIWWETHVAYLESKNMENSDAQNIHSKTPRPTSATSLRSSRYFRANKSKKYKDIKFRPVTAASSPTFNPRHRGCFNTQHFVLL